VSRREFSKQVRREAHTRANGQCEGHPDGERCPVRLTRGRFHYDHDIPDALGGEPTLENCVVLCIACHKDKTGTKDVPAIAKTKRIQDREKGIKKPRSITGWRAFDGSIVRAARER
jgi:5-methylcytosine-specific restriction protein A